MKRLTPILPAVLVLLLPAAMLYPLWTNPFSAGEDDLVTYYPLRKLVADSLREGRSPLHNPLEATGTPLMADPQASVMFPMTWLFAFVDGRVAFSLSIFAAFAAGGLGAYLYLRRVGLVTPAAVFGAVAFEFCGFAVAHRAHLNMIQTAAFLPWGLWAIEGLPARPGKAFLALVPIAFLSIAAGHWGILAYMAVAWAAYLFLRARPLGRSLAVAGAAAALAAVIAAPQLALAFELYQASTRAGIGYATAGENSFHPSAAVLALFPFLMGSRGPNFFPQRWWGPWHLCEMLGYIGLVTLALAGVAVWRLYRKPKPGIDAPPEELRAVGLVRIWTWIGAGAVVWMLGYYLPTFRLVYWVPILGKARCPARMLLVVDMALATLAAMTIHSVITLSGDRVARLRKAARRAATMVLPVAMFATLLTARALGSLWRTFWPQGGPAFAYFNGGREDVLEAAAFWNPAVWVPIALVVVTGLAVRRWVSSYNRTPACSSLHGSGAIGGWRVWVLVLLLLLDLFTITRFVDVPDGSAAPDFAKSPAAAWLRDKAPEANTYRIWGLGRNYCDRPLELLLPKAGQALGFATIASYGTWHSPAHGRLLGFDRYGRNSEWPWLIRRNHLLSLYGVRFILAADREFRDVIESVRLGDDGPPGAPVALGPWQFAHARSSAGVVLLQAPPMLLPACAAPARAWSGASLKAEAVYTVRLEARGPDGGAGDLYVRLYGKRGGGVFASDVSGERIGPDWRRFEWTFRTQGESCLPKTAPACLQPQEGRGGQAPADVELALGTISERPIEARNIEVRESRFPVPINLGGRLDAGRRVYELRAELPSVNRGERPVAIYENLLWQPIRAPAPLRPHWGPAAGASPQDIERLRWPDAQAAAEMAAGRLPALPDVSLSTQARPGALLALFTAPAAVVYAAVAAGGPFIARRRRRKGAV